MHAFFIKSLTVLVHVSSSPLCSGMALTEVSEVSEGVEEMDGLVSDLFSVDCSAVLL